MMKPRIKILHWTPRIICILSILFISLFAMDSFHPDMTIWQQIADFLKKLIPSFGLIILLIVAWKWEFIGGIMFILIGLGFSPFIFMHNYEMNPSIWRSMINIMAITMPIVIVGILFIVSHHQKKKSFMAKTGNA